MREGVTYRGALEEDAKAFMAVDADRARRGARREGGGWAAFGRASVIYMLGGRLRCEGPDRGRDEGVRNTPRQSGDAAGFSSPAVSGRPHPSASAAALP